MKTVLALVLVAALPAAVGAASHPFNVQDLVTLERVSSPALSPDGSKALYQLRQTDYEANRGLNSLWSVDLAGGEPLKLIEPGLGGGDGSWSPDGRFVYFLAPVDKVNQLWRVTAKAGEARAASKLPLDVGSYKLAPDGRHVAFSLEVFPACTEEADPIACTKAKLDQRAADKTSGTVYDKLFIRHWDNWADGRRAHLFIAGFDDKGRLGTPKLLTRGIDGDVPSKPFGDSSEYGFSPDGKTIYFNARIAGDREPWSTNFDIYRVPADGAKAPENLTPDNKAWDGYPLASRDGKTLYWLAMKRPGFEADRFGIMALDLASGARREVAPNWDRSASPLRESVDGKTLYTTSDDWGDHALFAIDAASGAATKLVAEGSVTGFDVGRDALLVARQNLRHPTDLYRAGLDGKNLTQITHANAERLRDIRFGEPEFFTFEGVGGDTVQGYVVKPVDYRKGRKYPVAFIVHGGPQGAMTNDFHYRWNPQTYAGQGFAVVTINFHGSTGYGQKFTDAISGDWGGAPLEDLKLGWAAAQQKYPFLDANRACALGASYGGYMMFWMAGVWNEPWKCIVAHDGVFDARMMAYSTEELWFDTWEHDGKEQWQAPGLYEKFNPVTHVKDWRTPILVVHGQQDFRIPVEQGIAAFTAAQSRGVPSKFLYFPDENHWVLKPHNSVLWHDTVNDWLKRWTQ